MCKTLACIKSRLYFYSNCLPSTENLKFDEWNVLVSYGCCNKLPHKLPNIQWLKTEQNDYTTVLDFRSWSELAGWISSGGLTEESSFLASIWSPSAALAYCTLLHLQMQHSIIKEFVLSFLIYIYMRVSYVLGILQERILAWVAIPFSRVSSWSKNWTWVLQADSLPSEPSGKPKHTHTQI